LSQAAPLNPANVSVTGLIVANYGPATVSGSGTNYTITLSQPISAADRVTFTTGNASITTFTRRLDVLPGDVNDDGVVNTTDGVLLLRNFTPSHPYQAIYDLNGDGTVDRTDFNLYRPFIGTTLPPLPQLAAEGEGPGGAAPLTQQELAPILTAAVQRWIATGFPVPDVQRLESVTAQVADLPSRYLGGAVLGATTIYLSPDAADYRWFIDPNPMTNTAFPQTVTMTQLQAAGSSPPAGHEDLLTVVMHKLGHTLGLDDLAPSQAPTDLMTQTLATGVRRLPSPQDLAALLPQIIVTSVTGEAKASVSVPPILPTIGQGISPSALLGSSVSPSGPPLRVLAMMSQLAAVALVSAERGMPPLSGASLEVSETPASAATLAVNAGWLGEPVLLSAAKASAVQTAISPVNNPGDTFALVAGWPNNPPSLDSTLKGISDHLEKRIDVLGDALD
jgi:hypothetical protein